MMGAGTVRSCVACRRKGDKGELLKLANTPMGVVIDYSERLPGRGAYVCAEDECITKALNESVLSRAFRHKAAPPDKEGFYRELRGKVERKVTSLLGMARKSGLAAFGAGPAAELMKRSPYGLLILAEDVSENTGRRLNEANEGNRFSTVRYSTKDGLGNALGASPVGVVFIPGTTLAAKLDREIRRLISIGRG